VVSAITPRDVRQNGWRYNSLYMPLFYDVSKMKTRWRYCEY